MNINDLGPLPKVGPLDRPKNDMCNECVHLVWRMRSHEELELLKMKMQVVRAEMEAATGRKMYSFREEEDGQ